MQVGTFQQPDGYTCAQALLSFPERPTAIFASNDLTAYGVMEAVRDRGLRIPEDMFIIGFDDIPQSLMTHPTLTTVRQPLQEMGCTAVQMLLNLIDNPDQPQEPVRLNTQLVLRGTCQALASNDISAHTTHSAPSHRNAHPKRRAKARQGIALRK